jgi:hypothetical protein
MQLSRPSGPIWIRRFTTVLLLTSNLVRLTCVDPLAPLRRYTKEEHLLKQAKDLIEEGFPQATNFQPNSMLICTWKDVHSYLDRDSQVRITLSLNSMRQSFCRPTHFKLRSSRTERKRIRCSCQSTVRLRSQSDETRPSRSLCGSRLYRWNHATNSRSAWIRWRSSHQLGQVCRLRRGTYSLSMRCIGSRTWVNQVFGSTSLVIDAVMDDFVSCQPAAWTIATML